ncbi:hypothetical protein M1L60_05940 [Actinoplanes sp. TRM 88003]|uniref:Adenylate kinase n=1 Tax=Paractinoplanes aksuensis TaxID=2939490 RepID=A0ABT1DH25_9ACTN|nr:hypothetical protein [Actinoplanes aksuensis]MCO8270132.1 hypothetical protein [Actinoplanes aksuensis]
MEWTPEGTVRNALWICGGQWAGKTTVAGILVDRLGVTHYHYDFHSARGHEDRRVAARARSGDYYGEPDWESVWIGPTPAEMAATVLADFPERFQWVLDDLSGLVSPRPILVDGWGCRPELVAAVTDPARMVVMVPTDEWRLRQAARLPRAMSLSHKVSDPELAAHNRIERDRLIALDAVARAHEYGIPVIEVDGTRPAELIADEVAEHFRPYLES